MSTSYSFRNENLLSTFSDPDNRDPLRINKHFQLDFFNVIAEPDTSAYNFRLFHGISHDVYHYTKLFIYRLLTTIIGILLMFFWGLLFGVYTFLMIWFAVPVRRLIQSCIGEIGLYVQTISDAAIGPLHHSMGQIFSNIRLFISKENIELIKPTQV